MGSAPTKQSCTTFSRARKPHFRPSGVSPLGVAVHSRTQKKRLIFDLRILNKFLFKRPFKYEGVETVQATARKGDCAFSLDLSAAYHHVELSQAEYRWFGFQWDQQYYEFCSLPFGLAPACRTFTVIVRALAARSVTRAFALDKHRGARQLRGWRVTVVALL